MDDHASDYGTIILWSLLLIGLIVAGWLTVWQVKRRLQRPDVTAGAGFSLSDLRQLHRSGQMSDEEFERAKARVVDAARRATAREAEAQAGPGSAGGARSALRGEPRPPRGGPLD
jgi:hypothetical protein